MSEPTAASDDPPGRCVGSASATPGLCDDVPVPDQPGQPVAPDRAAAVALWLLPLSCLAVLPGGFDRFALPKLLVAAIALTFAFLATRSGSFPRSVTVLAGLVVVSFVVAALAGSTPIASLVGRWPRYEGLPTLLMYGACAVAGARLLGGGDARRRRHLLRALRTVALASAVAALFDAVGHPLLGASDVARAGALLGNATDLAVVAVLVLGPLLTDALERPRPAAIAATAAALLTVVLAASRAGLIGAAVVLVVVLAARGRRGARALLPATAALVVAALAVPATRERLLAERTVTGRRLLWEDTWSLIRENPWLGTGPSRYVDAIGAEHGLAWARTVGAADPPDAPHLWLLQAWAVGGIPLLLSCLALALLVVRIGLRRLRGTPDPLVLGSFAAVIAYGVMLLTHFTTSGTAVLAAFLAGIVVARPGRPATAIIEATGRGAAVLALAAAVVLTPAAAAEIPLRSGLDQAASGDLATAAPALDAARRLRPWDSDIGMLVAQALAAPASMGDTAAARETLRWSRIALRRTPDSGDALLARGVALIALGRLPEAERVLDRAVALQPVDPRPLVQRGIARFGQADVAGSLADLRRAADLDPDDATAGQVLREVEARLAQP